MRPHIAMMHTGPCSFSVAYRDQHKFTGKERDAESNLDFFGARHYASSLGRFMSPDPLGGHNEDPQTLNRYAYVRNNPLSLTDPTGLDFNLQCTQTKDNASTCQGGVVGTTTTDANGKSTFNATVVTSASLQDSNSGNTATVNAARALLGDRGSFTIPFEDARGAHPFSTQHRFGGPDCSFLSCANSPRLSVAYDPGTSNYVAAVKQEPKANVPSTGGSHVDAHADWIGHAQDVSNAPRTRKREHGNSSTSGVDSGCVRRRSLRMDRGARPGSQARAASMATEKRGGWSYRGDRTSGTLRGVLDATIPRRCVTYALGAR